MLGRTRIGIVGIAGLVAGVWFLVYALRRRNADQGVGDRFYNWLVTLDSFLAALGWVMWMGLFGTFVSISITGQSIV